MRKSNLILCSSLKKHLAKYQNKVVIGKVLDGSKFFGALTQFNAILVKQQPTSLHTFYFQAIIGVFLSWNLVTKILSFFLLQMK
jgi:hypothetical protein